MVISLDETGRGAPLFGAADVLAGYPPPSLSFFSSFLSFFLIFYLEGEAIYTPPTPSFTPCCPSFQSLR